jgi:hypothetical protein
MRLNHLFFADDSLLFCKANILEWLHIQDILATYEQASGQKLNKKKTSIFFSRNTKAATKQHLLLISWVACFDWKIKGGSFLWIARENIRSN